jgi:hypothetical protein
MFAIGCSCIEGGGGYVMSELHSQLEPTTVELRELRASYHPSLAPTTNMASRNRLVASATSSLLRNARPLAPRSATIAALLHASSTRHFSQLSSQSAPSSSPASIFNLSQLNSQAGPPSYFGSHKRLPTNTVVRFVPQQTAWIVERMGKFNRILDPGLAILIPFIDRIAYVKSLKENAIEIPSQSAITADNVTLELDGVLYTRVFDAYKAR